jgi:hypothetical protein
MPSSHTRGRLIQTPLINVPWLVRSLSRDKSHCWFKMRTSIVDSSLHHASETMLDVLSLFHAAADDVAPAQIDGRNKRLARIQIGSLRALEAFVQ